MNIPEWVKPAAFGVVGGMALAALLGFNWGGWVTGGTAKEMATDSAELAIIQAFAPLCAATAKELPAQLVLLKGEKSWARDKFIVKAGWVNDVSEKYRTVVAEACATRVIAAMEAK